jgi:hypothetical protein
MFAIDVRSLVWRNPSTSLNSWNDVSERALANPGLDPSKRTFIAIIEGQSLAGNHCPATYQPVHRVEAVDVLGGRQLYQHREPMLGASYYPVGHGGYSNAYGSIWGKVGDLLISTDVFDRVIWCNVSYGGIDAASLAPSGNMSHRLAVAFASLRLLGISVSNVSAVLSMLGESDAGQGTSTAVFAANRLATVQTARNLGFEGPWFQAQNETYVMGSTSSAISNAQAELVGNNGVIGGPSFDDLGSAYRWDDIHQNENGLNIFAQRWRDVLALHYA